MATHRLPSYETVKTMGMVSVSIFSLKKRKVRRAELCQLLILTIRGVILKGKIPEYEKIFRPRERSSDGQIAATLTILMFNQ